MKPNINSKISDGRNLEKQIKTQMGCMTGIFQIFDRHQILSSKRLDSEKPLPCFSTSDSISPSERSDMSSTSFAKVAPPSVGGLLLSPENNKPAKPSTPLRIPVFELKDGVKTSWKLREAPRLSLDSRAVFDEKGKLRPREIRANPPSDFREKHRRCPSVVARLMGLDALPHNSNEENCERSELRRSASESRASRDLNPQFNFRKLSDDQLNLRKGDFSKRKSYLEAQEFFPQVNGAGIMYDEIEKWLRMRGIEDSVKDLETRKQILEAIKLKGLLRSEFPESSITVRKQSSKPRPKSACSLQHRNESSRCPVKSMRDHVRRNVESHSAVSKPNRLGSDQLSLRSTKIRRPKAEISPYENSSSLGSSTKFDFQRVSRGESKSGRSLLERCDKLLHSIAAITSSVEQVTATDQQPSPVSVLDSSFLCEENSASPIPKRLIDFEDQIPDWQDHQKQNSTPNAISESSNGSDKEIGASQSNDYAFVAEVLRETDRHCGPLDTFSALEHRHCFSASSIISILHRRHLFDLVTEILERKRDAPSSTSLTQFPSNENETSLLQEVWEEVQWLQQHVSTENLIDLIGKLVNQDMAKTAAGEQEWRVFGVEISFVVLQIERQLFKDLVSDIIRELSDLACKRTNAIPRRKLIF